MTQAVAAVVGKDRWECAGCALFATTEEDRVYLGLVEDDPHETYIEAVDVLEEIGIAYASLAEADWDNAPESPETFRSRRSEEFQRQDPVRGKIHRRARGTGDRGRTKAI